MANTLRFKRGLLAGLPSAAVGEPLFTTDTFDLYIGTASGTQKYQKFIASGTTSQLLRGDGSLLTMPIVLSSPANGEVLKYNGTNWVNSSDAGITGSGVAGQVAYFTGATTQGGSNNLFWDATNNRLGIGTNTPAFKLDVASASGYNFIIGRGASGSYFESYSIGGVRQASFGSESNGDTYIGSRSNNPMIFLTNATEVGRFFANGNFRVGSNAADAGFRLDVSGTMRVTGISSIIGSSTSAYISTIRQTNTTADVSFGLLVTAGTSANDVAFRVQNAAQSTNYFTVLGNGTSNFSGNLLVGSTTDNGLRFQVTGDGYFSGSVGIGSTSLTGVSLAVGKNISGAGVSYGILQNGQVQSAVGFPLGIANIPSVAASLSINAYRSFYTGNPSIGAGSTITELVGYYVESNFVGGTSTYAYQGAIPSGTGRWNLYMNGTAANYLNGSLSIGTTTQSGKLYVTLPGINTTFDSGTAADARIEFRRAGTRIGLLNWDSGVVTLQADSGNYLGFNAGGTERARIFAGGNFAIGSTSDNGLRFQVTGDGSFSGFITANSYIYAGNGSTQTEMRINSSGGANEGPLLRFMKASANVAYIGTYSSIVSGTSNDLTFYSTSSQQWMTNNSGTTKMLLDASGNLGLGVTPSAWGATWRALELQYSSGGQAIAAYYPAIIANAYNTGGGFFYKQTSQASYYQQIIGQHRWFNAPSGTAGTAVTFTQAMTLDASGNLLVGTTTALYSAAGRGVVNINGTSTAILSLNINSNTNTGGYLYYDGTTINLLNSTSGGSLLFSTANTERARIDASGNLGLGTTSPTGGRLQVVSTLSRTIYAQNQLSTGNVQGIVSESVTTNTGYNAAFLANAANGAGGNFSFYGVGGNIYNAGNTLLGTLVDAGFRLDVNGTMRVSGASTLSGGVTLGHTGGVAVTFPGGQAFRSNGGIFIDYGNGGTGDLVFRRGAGVTNTLTLAVADGAATFSSSVTAGGNLLLTAGTASSVGAINLIRTGTSPVASRLTFGTDGTGYSFAIGKNQGGTVTDLLTILDSGAATFSSTISSTGTNGFAIGNLTNTQRIQYGSDVATSFTLLTAANAYAGLYAGAVVLSGNLTVDTNTLFVDSSANRVGVGTASPLYALHVTGDGYFGDNVRFPNLKGCVFVQTGGSLLGSIAMDSANAVTIDNNGFAGLSVGGSFTMTGGNLGIGHSAFGTSATKTISVNSGTAPSTSPADAFQLYSADITAGNAAPHFRTENGGIIKLYQQTTAVTSATYIGGAGTTVTDLDTFDGYTIPQIVKALRNAGLLA